MFEQLRAYDARYDGDHRDDFRAGDYRPPRRAHDSKRARDALKRARDAVESGEDPSEALDALDEALGESPEHSVASFDEEEREREGEDAEHSDREKEMLEDRRARDSRRRRARDEEPEHERIEADRRRAHDMALDAAARRHANAQLPRDVYGRPDVGVIMQRDARRPAGWD